MVELLLLISKTIAEVPKSDEKWKVLLHLWAPYSRDELVLYFCSEHAPIVVLCPPIDASGNNLEKINFTRRDPVRWSRNKENVWRKVAIE